MTTTNDSAFSTRRETKLGKARRLLDEDRVSEREDGTFRVLGDSGIHKLAFGKTDLHCSCKAGGFGNGCSHRFAVELHMSRKRERVA